MNDREQLVLTIRAEPGDWLAPPEVRLRRLLKAMLRAYGWRVVDMAVPASPPASGQPAGRLDGPNAVAGR